MTKVIPESLEKGRQTLKRTVKALPESPGIYQMCDETNKVLYVGKAKNIKKRVTSYTHVTKLPHRLKFMVSQIDHVDIITTHTEAEALLLEANFIKKYSPPFNVIFKDDKSFPYIMITKQDQWARLTKHRGPRNTKKASYFGPFASTASVNSTLTTLQKAFLLRSCTNSYFNNRTRPCLLYDIKRCSGPCVGKISQTNYDSLVKEAHAFLNGKTRVVQEKLSLKMAEFSELQEYEMAAAYRDRIRALNKIQADQSINIDHIENTDIFGTYKQDQYLCVHIAIYRHGRYCGSHNTVFNYYEEKNFENALTSFICQFYLKKDLPSTILTHQGLSIRQLLEKALNLEAQMQNEQEKKKNVKVISPQKGKKLELIHQAEQNAKIALDRKLIAKTANKALRKKIQDIFSLPTIPDRIEVYDNSHISGTNAYGVVIVAGEEGFIKNAYRQYTFNKSIKGGDDYAMMRDVFSRRFKNTSNKNNMPDLIIIDGGKGQLSSVVKIFKELELNTDCLVAMSKGPDRNAGEEIFHQYHRQPITLQKDDSCLYYLQKLRDEAHRFAITSHRQKRSKKAHISRLDEIPSIGPKRKKALLQYFGSVKAIEQAGISEIKKVDGISAFIAKMIYDHFHS